MMISGPMKTRFPAMPGQQNNPHELWIWSAQDFELAYRKGRWNWILSKVTRRPNKLPSLNELTATCSVYHQFDRGMHIVAVNEIVGSAERVEDFDREFMPLRSHTKQRWISINRAYYLDAALPPVELIQVNNQYVVSDGHHRISVARSHGQAYVEAHIIQMEMRCREIST